MPKRIATSACVAPHPCPLCLRPMLTKGASVDEHHLIPKSQGGTHKHLLHKVCHRKIHALFTEPTLAKQFYTFELLRAHPDVQSFCKFLRSKPIDYYTHSKKSNTRF